MAQRNLLRAAFAAALLVPILARVSAPHIDSAPVRLAPSSSSSAATRVPDELMPAIIAAVQQGGGAAYHARPALAGGTSIADNAEHGFAARFGPRQAEVSTADDERFARPLALAARRLEVDGHTHDLTGQRQADDAGRVAYAHGPAEGIGLTEWFRNGPLGLQHGFDVTALPSAARQLAVVVDVGAAWTAEAIDGATDSVSLRRLDGTDRLAYRYLRAWDATGRFLPATMTAVAEGIRLSIDLRGARLPITIDPLLQQATLAPAGNTANFGVGTSVAVRGGRALVGAPLAAVGANAQQGAVYFFQRSTTTGLWTLRNTLTDPVGQAGDQFGYSVALGSYEQGVIGAPWADPAGVTNGGKVFRLFINDSGNTTLEELDSPRATNDLFGWSVAAEHRRIVAGAVQDTFAQFGQGTAQVWDYFAGTDEYGLIATLSAPAAAATDHFGYSVAVAGDTIAVGAPDVDIVSGGTRPNVGAVYVFTRSGDAWPFQARIDRPDTPYACDNFGSSVAVNGDIVWIGSGFSSESCSPGANGVDVSQAHEFRRSGTTWSRFTTFTPSDCLLRACRGAKVGFAGTMLAVGLPNEQIDGVATGIVKVYRPTGAGFPAPQIITLPGAIAGSRFGASVDPTGSTLVAGKAGSVSESGSGHFYSPAPGDLVAAVGTGVAGYNGFPMGVRTQLNRPFGIAVNATTGRLLIADTYNHLVREYNPDRDYNQQFAGTLTNGFSGDGSWAYAADLSFPTDVAVDGSGRVYIADSGNSRVRRVTSGIITTVAGNGVFGYAGDGGPATSAQINQPYGIGVDSAGNLYIADTVNHRVRRVDAATGVIATIAGTGTDGYNGDGIAATNAHLASPRDVEVAPDGTLYVADTGNNRIRRIDLQTGQITTVLGTGTYGYTGDGGPAVNAQIGAVEKIVVDSAGTLILADLYHHRLRRVSGGIVDTIAGTGDAGSFYEGGPALSAQLHEPYAVAVSTANGIYFAEQAQSRVRRIEPAGPSLTYTRAGTGLGTVLISPGAISCPTSCSATMPLGTSVTLTAASATTSTFTGWSGDCTGTNNCTVTMSQARSVTATFNAGPQLLTVTRSGAGIGSVSSNPAGISCGADCTESYPANTSVTLTATANTGSTFAGWTGEGCSGTGTCVVTMSQARNVTAAFNTVPLMLTVTLGGTGSGSVSSNPAGISCGSDCSEMYPLSTTVTLTATAAAGSSFSGWAGEGCAGTGTCNVTMTQVRAVTASFASLGQAPTILSRTPALGSTGGGTIVIITGQNFVAGTTVRIGTQPLAAQITGTAEIRIVTPAATAGQQTITVQTPHGEATTTFDYVAPVTETRGGWRRPAFAASRYTAFESALPMLPEDTNGVSDVYVHDDVTDTLRRVSISTTGRQAIGGESVRAAIDPTGRFVAFESLATNLVLSDTNGLPDVFLHDRDSDDDGVLDELGGTSTTRASVSSTGAQALGGGSGVASLDGTGRFVAFQSSATNLVANDTNPGPDVFVHDRLLGRTVRVSVATDNSSPPAGSSLRPVISQNGRFIAFDSAAALVAPDSNGARDVYVHDRDLDRDGVFDEAGATATRRVSIASSGAPTTTGDSVDASITGDGRHVVFASDATGLVAGDTNGVTDIFLHDRDVDADGVFDEIGQVATRRLSIGAGGAQLTVATGVPRISANGAMLVFLVAVPLSSPVVGPAGTGPIVQAVASDPGKSTGGWRGNPTEPNPGPVVIDDPPAERPDQDIEDPAVGPDGNKRGGTDVGDTPQVVVIEIPEDEPTPFIGGLSRGYGAPAGGTLVTISGRDLDGTLYWNGLPLATGSRTATEWTVVTPARGAGPETVPIHIQVGGRRSNTWTFTYVAQSTPRWTDHQPRSAPVTGGATLTITGSGFLNPTVRLGPYEVTPQNPSAGSLVVTVPPALVAGPVPVVIVNADGAEATSRDPFTYENGAGPVAVQLVQPESISIGGGDAVTIFGSGFLPGTTVAFGARPAANVQLLSSRALLVEAPSGSPGSTSVTVSVPGQPPVSGSITYAPPQAISLLCTGPDVDGDGMDDVWERQFGLAAGDGSDGSGDPDYDGRTSAEECAAGTHPRGLYTRYLAEGATGSFFKSRVVIANPGSSPARVFLRFQTRTGQTPSKYVLIPAMSRYTVDVGLEPGLSAAEFSTVVESDVDVVVDRTMLWGLADGGVYGSHAESSLVSPRTDWYLAEGATTGDFQLYYLLQNPSPAASIVRVRYLRPNGLPPIERDYTVPGLRRLTISVDIVPGLEAAEVSAAFHSLNGVPFIVERAMYLTRGARPFESGHDSAAIDAPSTRWFFAEGATGAMFDTYLLLANPNDAAADVTIAYLLSTGVVINRTYQLRPNSRTTVYVAEQAPELASAEVSSVVTVTNGVPIVAERAMWWPGYRMATPGYPFPIIWGEAHNSPGATATGTKWAVADGETGVAGSTLTYLLVANTSVYAADVSVTLLGENGQAPTVRHFSVPANSRFTVDVWTRFPETQQEGSRTFSAIVESHAVGGQAPAQIVVERAMYSDAVGIRWAAGSNLLATRLR